MGMLDITDHGGLLEKLGMTRIAGTIGLRPVTIRAWKARNNIPAQHWPPVIALAASDGLPVSAEWLMMRQPKRSRPHPVTERAGA